jgi:hypothetical protein
MIGASTPFVQQSQAGRVERGKLRLAGMESNETRRRSTLPRGPYARRPEGSR